jgi:hypothetical protein
MASSRKSAGARPTARKPASRPSSAAAKATAPRASAAKKTTAAGGGAKAVAGQAARKGKTAKAAAAKPLGSAAKKAAPKKAAPGAVAAPSAKRADKAALEPPKVTAPPKVAASAAKVAARTMRGKKAEAAPAASKAPAARKATAAPGPKARARRGAAKRVGLEPPDAPHAVPGLSEEDQIRAAKYLPREMPKRVFEEERFIFPETYGVNRIRLLVRDPEWIFAYWDVSPAAMKDFARRIGERALALSRLTLRVVDPVSGGSTDILLPPGARWWYVRTDAARRTYRAELGVTLPSGEFRRLAESNTVVTPRVGPSPERARRRMSYPDARELPVSEAVAASEEEKRNGVAREPWAPGAVEGAETPASVAGKAGQSGKGGASDTFRPGGASDAFPGASDTFRR